ncbi:MAG: hypothetical protein IKA96_03090, partial [Alistipes sp.]|nr:hypothetical protein [Alistipes sp.]
GISREVGSRSKVAVRSNDDRIDPVGACVGVRGTRVKEITKELGNERIDIVPWSSDIKQYAVTAGFGFPLQLFGNSSIDVGFEWGMRDPSQSKVTVNGKDVGLVKQNYFKLAVGLSLFGDDWFRRHRFQ